MIPTLTDKGREVCDSMAVTGSYWYRLELTGVAAIDRLIGALHTAGKAFHNTEMWADEEYAEGLVESSDHTYADLIQATANEAADALRWRDAETEPPEDRGARVFYREKENHEICGAALFSSFPMNGRHIEWLPIPGDNT